MRLWDAFFLDDLPQIQREFAEAWRATEKVDYSSTLDTVPEPPTRLERAFDARLVRTMKDTAERDLSIAGAGLAAEAIRAGLVDRYLLRLVPTIVGGGASALPDAVRVDLALDTTRRFDDGSVIIDYRLQGARTFRF